MKLRPLVFAFLPWSCAAPPPAHEVASPSAPATELPPPRWGEVEIVRPTQVFGEVVVSHGSALEKGDQWAIHVRFHRTAFARLARMDARGRTAFDTDLGRMTPGAGTIRVPTGAGDYLTVDTMAGTEYVVLMLSDAPLEPAASEALRASVLRAEPASGVPRARRKRPKPPAEAPRETSAPTTEEEPYVDFDLTERTSGRRGPYLEVEVEGGRRAATWIRFEHRAAKAEP